MRLYRCIHKALLSGVASCHDLSDGGLAVAVCESALAGKLGVYVELDSMEDSPLEPQRLLFCETPSRFLVSVPRDKEEILRKSFENTRIYKIGRVVPEPVISITLRGRELIHAGLDEVDSAWKTPIDENRTYG